MSDESYYYRIEGGTPLKGEFALKGAKNAALPCIVAACLSDETTVLNNVPTESKDVRVLMLLLNQAGARVRESRPQQLECSGANWKGGLLDENASLLRHSLLLLGLSAHRDTGITLPLPGGCKLGSRKHDLHVLAFRALGFDFDEQQETLLLGHLQRQQDSAITFHYPSFGATINVLLAATGRTGLKTILNNAARNPEVLDLVRLLQKMGAHIVWLNDHTLCVEGKGPLRGTQHQIMGDRIVAATLMTAAGLTRGKVSISGISAQYLQSEISCWRKAGLSIREFGHEMEVSYLHRLSAQSIRTQAYPGFHTDIQPLHAALMLMARGSSRIEETILNGRFKYAEELRKMGASATIEEASFTCVNGKAGQILKIKGVNRLSGSTLTAPDIRGGAALVLAAMAAEGVSTIQNIYQIERGYGNMAEIFSKLGASIQRLGHIQKTA